MLTFGALAYTGLTKNSATFPDGWLELWNRWDAPHYLDIARDGYVTENLHDENQRFWIVFYPLYPWTVRLVAAVLNDYLVAAHVVSFIAAIAAALLFLRLAALDLDEERAQWAVVLLFIFPTAYFFHAGYTESLFLVFTLGCVLAARRRRWNIAAISGALASLTRVNGMLLIPVMLVEAYEQYRREQRRFQKAWLWIPFAAVGFLIYLSVNQRVWNDPFYFQKPLAQYWGKKLASPWTGIGNAMAIAQRAAPDRALLFGVAELVFLALLLAVTIWSWRRTRPSYAVWMTLNLLLIASTSIVMSTPRYALSFFPMFLFGAQLLFDRPFMGKLLVFSSVSLMALLTTLFVLGQWAF